VVSFRLQREQEFLRASLRESKKLQNLEKRSHDGSAVNADGFVNRAFDRDASEEETEFNGAASAASGKAKSLDTMKVDVGNAVSKCLTWFRYV